MKLNIAVRHGFGFGRTWECAIGDAAADDKEYALALWALLWEDAFAELNLLALRPTAEAPPGQEPPGAELHARVLGLTAPGHGLPPDRAGELDDILQRVGLAAYVTGAHADVIAHPSYQAAVARAVEPLTDYRLAVARAILARSVQRLREDQEVPAGYLPLDGATRDRVVELLVAALGGREAAVVAWVKAQAGRVVTGIGNTFRQHRF